MGAWSNQIKAKGCNKCVVPVGRQLLDRHSSGSQWFLSGVFELVLSVFNLIFFPLAQFVAVSLNFKHKTEDGKVW